MLLYLWHHLRRPISVGLTRIGLPTVQTVATSVGLRGNTFISAGPLQKILVLTSLSLFSIAASADQSTRVLVIGDSLSAAYGLNMEQGWVTLLEQRLQGSFTDASVINASISGETTRGGAYRLPPLLEKYEPNLVIIELGGNDGLRALPIKQMRDNLTEMTENSLAAGAQVLLLAAEAPPNLGRRYTQLFRGIYDTLGQDENVENLPFIVESVFLNPSLMQSDGIHPNAKAQPMLLEVVWPRVKMMLEDGSS